MTLEFATGASSAALVPADDWFDHAEAPGPDRNLLPGSRPLIDHMDRLRDNGLQKCGPIKDAALFEAAVPADHSRELVAVVFHPEDGVRLISGKEILRKRENNKMKKMIITVLLFTGIFCSLVYGQGFDKKIYAERRARLYEKLDDNSALILFGFDASRDNRFQNSEFIYLTGVDAPGSIYVGLKNNKREMLFLPPWNPAYNVWDDEILSPGKKAAELTGIRMTMDNTDFYRRIFSFLSRVDCIYINMDRAAGFEGPVSKIRVFIKKVQEVLPNVKIKDVRRIVNEQQGVKGPEEIEKLKKAIEICGKGVMEGIKYAEPGMWEYQVEALVDFIFRTEGAQRTLFNIVGSGKNSCILHHMTNDKRMETGTENITI